MHTESEKVYPHCMSTSRTIQAGGHTKQQLVQKMSDDSIGMNKYAEVLFADEYFTVSAEAYDLQTVELAVCDLGFAEGATTAELFNQAIQLGLELCPIEAGPYLRLAYLDQPEGYAKNLNQQNQAPNGSITIASKPLNDGVEFPKGFYLRRIEGVLWLRGYIADEEHVWEAEDRFVFCVPATL